MRVKVSSVRVGATVCSHVSLAKLFARVDDGTQGAARIRRKALKRKEKMRSLRSWATPLVAGAFGLMAVSGVLMFFHVNTDLSKGLHEWAGFVLLAGAGAHLVQNWRAFATYFRRPLALGIMGLGFAVTVASLVPLESSGEPDAFRTVLAHVGEAPVPVLASLAGQSVDQVKAVLTAAGFDGVTDASTIKTLVGEDMGAQIGVMSAVFSAE